MTSGPATEADIDAIAAFGAVVVPAHEASIIGTVAEWDGDLRTDPAPNSDPAAATVWRALALADVTSGSTP